MSKNIVSALKFRKYIVKNVEFILNDTFSNRSNVAIEFGIRKRIEYKEKTMHVELETIVFPNAEKNDYPFTIRVKIVGIFETVGEAKDRFETNAVAILYPYIRAIVSTYTAQANIPALVLPPINVNSLMEDSDKE